MITALDDHGLHPHHTAPPRMPEQPPWYRGELQVATLRSGCLRVP